MFSIVMVCCQRAWLGGWDWRRVFTRFASFTWLLMALQADFLWVLSWMGRGKKTSWKMQASNVWSLHSFRQEEKWRPAWKACTSWSGWNEMKNINWSVSGTWLTFVTLIYDHRQESNSTQTFMKPYIQKTATIDHWLWAFQVLGKM